MSESNPFSDAWREIRKRLGKSTNRTSKADPLAGRELHRAIREDIDNEAPRLDFADWLEIQGEAARAEWIRESCAFAQMRSSDEGWSEAFRRVDAAFERCRPSWWESIGNVGMEEDRGIYRFQIGHVRSSRGPKPAKRLGEVSWLGSAFDEGWLARMEILWDDGTLQEIISNWPEPASRIPLLIKPAPQIGDEDLTQILSFPQLHGLKLLSNVLKNPSAQDLTSAPKLHDLTLEFRLVNPTLVDALIDQIETMQQLRRLHLIGHDRLDRGNRPNDSDLQRLSGLQDLKRLVLCDSAAVTTDGIRSLKETLPSLSVDHQ